MGRTGRVRARCAHPPEAGRVSNPGAFAGVRRRGRASGSLASSAGDSIVSDATVSLLVNGEERSVPVGSTVRELLASLGLEATRIAVAVNRDVISRSRFDRHPLAKGDRVEILEAVGGG